MGRRSAPQPLALAEDVSSSALSEESRGPPSSTATTAAILGSSESTAPGTTDRPSPNSLFAPDNTLQVLAPSLSNKSPKSPRSPFSKFNPTRRPQTQQGEPRSRQDEESPPPLPPRSADDTHLLRKEPHYSTRKPQHPPAIPSISQSNTSPNLSLAQGRHEEKHSRNGSRFFNFGKGSRANNQLQKHTHTASNSEAMSRGLDLPTMAERVPSKSSKHSGTSD